jgi:hypothetical protein
MFYHMVVSDISSLELFPNKTREDVLVNYVCPFINREVTLHRGEIYNMAFPIGMRVFSTEQAITTDWPVNVHEKYPEKEATSSGLRPEIVRTVETYLAILDYKDQVVKTLEESRAEITDDIYKEAIMLLDGGEYRELRKRLVEEKRKRYAFFICPFGNEEIDHNYEFVIKPTFKAYQFDVERADEIASSSPVTELITNAIVRSRIVVADLTDERPNCYYEVGFAHALGKPVIILAREGTTRHFDISVYQWHYWDSYMDLKTKFEASLAGVLKEQDLI